MKEKIKHIIKSSLFNGMVKILYGTPTAGKSLFLQKELKKICGLQYDYICIHLSEKVIKNIRQRIEDINSKGNKTILVIDDVVTYNHIESLIELICCS